MGKKQWFVASLCLSLFLGGCSESDVAENEEYMIENESMDSMSEGGSEGEEIAEDSATNMEIGKDLIGEKVIRTIDREYETLDFEKSHRAIMDTTNEYDGFIESSSQSTDNSSDSTNRAYLYGYYTVRIPTESIDAFLDSLDEMDALKTSETINTEDITQYYTDTESRVNVLKNKEERLNTLLEQAESIEDIIQIETSLTETISERESLQSILDSYDSLIDYTSVQISLYERSRISGERGETRPFLQRATDAIVDSAYAFYYTAQNLIIGLIYALPFIIGIGLVIGVIYYINKKRNKHD